MKVVNISDSGYQMEYQGVRFKVVKTLDTFDVVGGWNNLAANTNTHPECLLDLIEETIYTYNQSDHKEI
jgi:hypothetical protein